jgi:hypothetical protein
MRYSLTAIAAIAVCGLFALAPARAEPAHSLGGPTQEGHLCWVSTQSDLDYGYWKECPAPEHVTKSMHRTRS